MTTTNIQQERTNIQKGCGKMGYHGNMGYQGNMGYHGNVYIQCCLSTGFLCPSCQARLSQHDKTMKLVMEGIDKWWVSQPSYILDEDIIELKKSLGGQK